MVHILPRIICNYFSNLGGHRFFSSVKSVSLKSEDVVTEKFVKMKEQIFLAILLAWSQIGSGQDLTLPYFNIALNKKITVNATCGENTIRKETYCKLVGYDSFIVATSNQILDGHVNWTIDYIDT